MEIKSGIVTRTRTEQKKYRIKYTITVQSGDITYEYNDVERTQSELITLCNILNIKYLHEIEGTLVDLKIENNKVIGLGSAKKDEWIYNTN